MVHFVRKRGPFCPECGPFCPGCGPLWPWSVLSMVRYVPNSKSFIGHPRMIPYPSLVPRRLNSESCEAEVWQGSSLFVSFINDRYRSHTRFAD